jgi:uncharacterized membrane protein YbhN (UPF0104 family)
MDFFKNSKERKPSSHWLVRGLTVLVSAGILYYFVRSSNWEEIQEAAMRAELLPAVLGATLPLFFFWLTDTAFTVKSFELFHRPVRFTDYLFIKAASYLLTMVNITFATGGIFLYFMKKTGISARKQAGLLLWRVSMAVFGMAIFFASLTTGLLVYYPAVLQNVRLDIWGPVLTIFILIFIEFGAYWLGGGGALLKRLPVDFRSRLWSAFRKSRPRHWLTGFSYTVPPIVVNFIGLYIVAKAFHIEVPFLFFLYSMPLVAVLSALPIAFGQFGTTTAAWALFFASFGAPEDIVAVTIFIPAVRLIMRASVGLVFMPMATRELESISKGRGGTGKE